MDWVRRIVTSGGELRAEVEAANNQVSKLVLTELARCGVPTPKALVRQKLEVRFADFNTCSAHEYLAHFGMCARAADTDLHQVFEVESDGVRYLVPALVMMRALFRPTEHLLHRMFAPSALERTCRLDCVGEELRVVVDAPWANLAAVSRNSDWEGPLRWMMLSPSARRLADSVHQYAMAGLIAMDLPDGQAKVVFAGVRGPEAVLVTEVRILTVRPSDAPDLPAADWVPRVDYINRDWLAGRNTRDSLLFEVPPRDDGGIELSNEEWAVVAPLLAGTRKVNRPYQLCQRAIFDGILGKLATGKSWREATYKVGDWRNAATSYNRWNSRGTFSEAMQALRDMR